MKRILCALIAVLCLCTCGREWQETYKIFGIESIDTRIEQLFSSLWRNDATGDWEIGFYEDFAISDCRYWQYRAKIRKATEYFFILTDGKSDLAVDIDKPQNGKRTMSINGKKAEYSLITTSTLPVLSAER